jgi:hypothetical protein
MRLRGCSSRLVSFSQQKTIYSDLAKLLVFFISRTVPNLSGVMWFTRLNIPDSTL